MRVYRDVTRHKILFNLKSLKHRWLTDASDLTGISRALDLEWWGKLRYEGMRRLAAASAFTLLWWINEKTEKTACSLYSQLWDPSAGALEVRSETLWRKMEQNHREISDASLIKKLYIITIFSTSVHKKIKSFESSNILQTHIRKMSLQ